MSSRDLTSLLGWSEVGEREASEIAIKFSQWNGGKSLNGIARVTPDQMMVCFWKQRSFRVNAILFMIMFLIQPRS